MLITTSDFDPLRTLGDSWMFQAMTKALPFALIAAFVGVAFVFAFYLFCCTARMVRAWWFGGDWQAELRKGSNAALLCVAVGIVVMGAVLVADHWGGGLD